MAQYIKKPVVINAIKWTGFNLSECEEFLGSDFLSHKQERCPNGKNDIWIKTLEGEHVASKGDYIVRGVKGEHYACKPDIFAMTYEEVMK